MNEITAGHDDPTVTQPKQSSEQDRLNACLAEYNALRTEIDWLIRDSTQYQNFAIGLIGALVAALAWILDKSPILLAPTLLIVPFLFSLLGFLFFRQHEEVYVVAAYLRDCIRPRVRSLTGDNAFWEWEEFKAQRTEKIKNGPFKALSTSRMVLILRTSLFLIPSIVSLLAIIGQVISEGVHQFMSTYSAMNSVLFVICFFIDTVLVMLFITHLCTQGDLASRILKVGNSVVEKEKLELPRNIVKKRHNINKTQKTQQFQK